jgi:GGDEF domain-containing protein
LEDKLLDHEVGDKELKEAASLVQAIIRAELKAARLSSLICQ